MGGRALSVPGCRLPAAEYHALVAEVTYKLAMAGLPRLHIIEAYASKESFGDMDLVYASFPGYDPASTAQALGAVEFVKNGEVTSFGLPMNSGLFQIDVIGVPADSVKFAVNYFRFNDLGNLYGRIFKYLGLKFGHHGLFYVMRDDSNSQTVREIVITRDFEAALELIKLQRLDRADTLTDIFQHVAQSPWFSKSIYRLENLNNQAKTRDRKRSTYHAFLQWMDQQQLPETLPMDHSRIDWREVMRQRCFDIFPEFKRDYLAAHLDYSNWRARREKFNGRLVGSWTGLQGRALGAFMMKANAVLDPVEIANLSQEQLRAYILQLFEQWKTNPLNADLI